MGGHGEGGHRGETAQVKGRRSGVGSSRQRVGPTYNREYKRAQHVPQRAPGDGRDPGMRHHILKPRHPRSLPHYVYRIRAAHSADGHNPHRQHTYDEHSALYHAQSLDERHLTVKDILMVVTQNRGVCF